MILIPAIIAVAASMVNVFDGSRFLATALADASGEGARLSNDPAGFTVGTRMASDKSVASPPEAITVAPSITSFSTRPKTQFYIGGDSYSVHGAGQSHSLTNPDPQTLRFEIRPGDHAWFDSSRVDRSEVSGNYIPGGTPIGINYQFMVQANDANNTFTNTASWLVVGQMHDGGTVAGTSPPFAMQLEGNHVQLVARYVEPGGNPSNGSSDLHMLTLWTDPNPIVPGQYYDINIHANVSNTGGGLLKLSVNGEQVVNYSGPLGFGSQTYWEQGVYRNAGPAEAVSVDFRNLTLTTGPRPR